jgi:hypothetical protein
VVFNGPAYSEAGLGKRPFCLDNIGSTLDHRDLALRAHLHQTNRVLITEQANWMILEAVFHLDAKPLQELRHRYLSIALTFDADRDTIKLIRHELQPLIHLNLQKHEILEDSPDDTYRVAQKATDCFTAARTRTVRSKREVVIDIKPLRFEIQKNKIRKTAQSMEYLFLTGALKLFSSTPVTATILQAGYTDVLVVIPGLNQFERLKINPEYLHVLPRQEPAKAFSSLVWGAFTTVTQHEDFEHNVSVWLLREKPNPERVQVNRRKIMTEVLMSFKSTETRLRLVRLQGWLRILDDSDLKRWPVSLHNCSTQEVEETAQREADSSIWNEQLLNRAPDRLTLLHDQIRETVGQLNSYLEFLGKDEGMVEIRGQQAPRGRAIEEEEGRKDQPRGPQ